MQPHASICFNRLSPADKRPCLLRLLCAAPAAYWAWRWLLLTRAHTFCLSCLINTQGSVANLLMVQCFAAAGMPPGLINCITGGRGRGRG